MGAVVAGDTQDAAVAGGVAVKNISSAVLDSVALGAGGFFKPRFASGSEAGGHILKVAVAILAFWVAMYRAHALDGAAIALGILPWMTVIAGGLQSGGEGGMFSMHG